MRKKSTILLLVVFCAILLSLLCVGTGGLAQAATKENITGEFGYRGSTYYWMGRIDLSVDGYVEKDGTLYITNPSSFELSLGTNSAKNSGYDIKGSISFYIYHNGVQQGSGGTISINCASENNITFSSSTIYTSSYLSDGNYKLTYSGSLKRGSYSSDVSGEYSFVVDTTAPTGTLNGVSNGGYTSGNVWLNNFSETATATLNGEPYTSDTSITAEGYHTLVLIDNANNSNTYTFTIDRIKPTGTLSGVTNGGFTNGNVSFGNFSETATATLNGSAYISGTLITPERTHTIILRDLAGNSTTYSFTIDKTKPTGSLSGVTNGGFTNGNVSLSNFSETATATLNGSAYTSGTSISSEGDYILILTDRAGNSTTYTFTIDKTAPTLIMKKGGNTIPDGTYFKNNEKFSFSFSETNINTYDIVFILPDGTSETIPYSYRFFSTAYYDNRISVPTEFYSSSLACQTVLINKEILLISSHTGYYPGAGGSEPHQTQLSLLSIGGDYFLYKQSDTKIYAFAEQHAAITVATDYAKTKVASSTSFVLPQDGTYLVFAQDKAGNETKRTIIMDTVSPTGILNGVANNGSTKNNVAFTWSESGATATLNGSVYTSGTSITAEGAHTIVLRDLAGNSTTYTFTIDKTAPTGSLSGVTNNGITKNNVTFSWSESGATATLNGASYSSGATINTEQDTLTNYTLVLTDIVGNSREYEFTIDRIKPTGTLSGVTNGGFTNGNVSFGNFSETATATLNGSAYISGTLITPERTHTIILRDLAGNSTTYTFTVDKTAPTGSLSGVTNNGFTNGNVSFGNFSETATATLNGSAYTSGTSISSEGDYILILTDRAGNSTTYTFTIDKTAPTGSLSGVTNGGFTNGNVSFGNFSETATATLNGSAYISGESIILERTHAIILTDLAGNSTTYTFTIDKTAPTGSLSGVTNGSITNKNVSFSNFSETATATLNGSAYTSGTSITAEGAHTIVLTDRAGNSTSYSFTIDKTKPTGTLNGVLNGGFVNVDVSFDNYSETATATLNGSAYSAGTIISTAPNTSTDYTIVLTDRAGNSTSYSFTIDKMAPTGTLFGVTAGGIINKNVTFSWSESGATSTLNGEPYTSGASITAENAHTIILTDIAGNSTTYTFTIDKTAPTGTLSGVENGGVTNGVVLFSWSENNCTIKVNNSIVSYSTILDENRITLSNEINTKTDYIIELFDKAGNINTKTFTINKIKPVGVLKDTNGNSILTEITNKDIKLEFNGAGVIATLNGTPYISNTLITTEQNTSAYLSFVLTDSLGNTNSYNITINKILPIISFFDGNNSLSVNGANTIFYNKNIRMEYESSCILYVNTNLTTNLILQIGSNESIIYYIQIVDTLGNTNNYTIDLDTIQYTRNYDYVFSNYRHHISKWYESHTYTYNNYLYIKSTSYSFSNLTDCISFAYNREMNIAEYHELYYGGNIFCDYANRYVDSVDVTSLTNYQNKPYYIYKDITNETKLVAYFNNTNLNNAINHYAEKSIITKTIPAVPSQVYYGDTFISKQNIDTDYININTNYFTLPYSNNANIMINGNVATYTTVLTEGINRVKETDIHGNSIEYTLMIDLTKPQAAAYDFAENVHTSLSEDFNTKSVVYHNSPFRLYVYDTLDPNCIFSISVNGSTTLVFAKDVTNYYDFVSSGEYTLGWRDLAGNNVSVTLYLSLETPSIELIENKNMYDILESFNVSIKKNLSFNQILSIDISLFNEETSSFETIEKDGQDTPITNTTLNYFLILNGLYKISVLDRFGTEVSMEYTFVKNAPTGSLLSALTNTVITNGARVNTQVKFTWKDAYALAYINDVEYIKNSVIVAEGLHTIKLVDQSSNITTYTFTIDRTNPEYILSGVVEGQGTNQNVSIDWTSFSEETKTKGFIKTSISNNFNTYSPGTIISAEGNYTIRIVDEAGNDKDISFFIDKTAPIITITATNGKIIQNNSITNLNLRFTWSESSATATLNGSAYTSGTSVSVEGSYNITVVDRVGNSNSARIRIDKSINEGTLTGVTNGGYTNGDVTFSWTDIDVTATLNGEPYTSGTTISAVTEKDFLLVIKDTAGNSISYSFTISKISPVVTFSDTQGLISFAENYYSKRNLSASFNKNCTATLNGEPYTSGTTISAEGDYSLILTDRAGNWTAYTFTIDKTKPTGFLNGVTNGGFTNGNVSLSNYSETATATLNGSPYIAEAIISSAPGTIANYTIVLTDRAGNSSEYFFTIDTVTPIGRICDIFNKEYENNIIINKNLKFTWSEGGATATLNGFPYASDTSITAEGAHTIVLTDRAGNSTTYNFTIDKNLPIYNFCDEHNNIIDSKQYFNFSLKILFWDVLTATLNGEPYLSGTTISEENSFLFIISNKAGNSSEYTFTIDKTAPTGTLINAINGGISNKSVSFSWSESGATATLNGSAYSSGTSITAERAHTIALTDRAGNSTTYTFTIDKTAPTGTLSGVTNNGNTKNNVAFSWSEGGATATLNGSAYSSGTSITAERAHTIALTDRAGNLSTYIFTIDKTAPTGTLSGVENGGYTNKSVAFSWSEGDATATLNGSAYSSGTSITAEGAHTIVLTDRAGNLSTYTFTIDKTAPTGMLTGITNGGITNIDVSFGGYSENSTATLNGFEYIIESFITEEGTHTIVLTDRAGNSTTYTFTIDKTAPTGTLSGVENGGYTNKSVSFSWSEIVATATLNGELYTKDTSIRNDGDYSIILTDRAGNFSVYNFVISKISPIGFVNNYRASGFYNEDVAFSWYESTYQATLNGSAYSSGTSVTAEGAHTIVLSDRAGNSTSYSFTIDKTNPTGTLNGAINGYYSNTNVKFVWNEGNAFATLNEEPYSSGTSITAERFYTIVLTDRAGNSSEYTFTIDKTAPTGTLSGVTNGGYTNKSVSFNWSESSATATLNGSAYTSGTSVTAEGAHTIVLRDLAGNSTTYTFTIDKTAPTGSLSGVTNGGYTNKSVSFNWSESGAIATLNGESYTQGTTISSDAFYTIVLTDRAGNSTNFTFIVYKKPISFIKTGLNELNYTNDYFYFSFDFYHAATLNGEPYTSGTAVSAEGVYLFTITNIVGLIENIDIIIDKTAPTVNFVNPLNGSLLSSKTNSPFSINKVSADITRILINNTLYNNNDIIYKNGSYDVLVYDRAGNFSSYNITLKTSITPVSFSTTFIENATAEDLYIEFSFEATAFLNDEPYESGSLIEGVANEIKMFTFIITDSFGNSYSYSFTINKTHPQSFFINKSSQIVSTDSTTNEPVSLTFDNSCSAYLGDNKAAKYYSGTYLPLPINDAVSYTITVVNSLGLSQSYTIFYNTVIPVINENYSSEFITNKDVFFSWNDSTYQSTLNGESYTPGTIILTEGNYLFTLTSMYNNISTYTFTIDKTAPILEIDGINEDGFATKNLYATWSETQITCSLNDKPYSKGTIIKDDDSYTIILTDRAGNSTKVSFILDKSVPLVSLIYKNEEKGLENNKVFYDNITLTSSDIIYVNGVEMASGTILSDIGIYLIEIKSITGKKTTYSITIKESSVTDSSARNKLIINIVLIILSFIVLTFILIIVIKIVRTNKKPIL